MTNTGMEPIVDEGFTVNGFTVTPEMIAAAARVMLREEPIWYHLGAWGAATLAEDVIRAALSLFPRDKLADP